MINLIPSPARSVRPALALALILGAAGSIATQAAPATPQFAPSNACTTGGEWQWVNGVGARVTTLAGRSDFDGGRLFAGSLTSEGGQSDHLWSGTLRSDTFTSIFDFNVPSDPKSVQVSDIAVSEMLPGISTRVWVGLFENGGIAGSQTGAPGTFAKLGSLAGWVMRLAATPSGVYAAASRPDQRGVWRWQAGGWTRVNQTSFDDNAPLGTPYLDALAASADGSTLYLGTDTKGLLKSTDGGVSWNPVWSSSQGSLARSAVLSLAVDPRDKNHVVAGLGHPADPFNFTGERGLRVTHASGAVDGYFNDPGAPVDLVSALAFSHNDPSIVFAATYGRGLRVSYDGGLSWQFIGPPSAKSGYVDALLTMVNPSEPTCELLFAGAIDGLWVRRIVKLDNFAFVPFAGR